MNPAPPAAFMTQTGYCHLLPDRIVLTSDGNYQRPLVQQRMKRQVVFNSLISVAIVGFFGYETVKTYNRDHFTGILFAVCACLLLVRLVASWRYSQAAVTQRSSIRDVRFIKAIPYLTRSRVIITFEDGTGRLQKRLIPLPGWLNEGDRHTQEVMTLLAEEGLLPFQRVF